MPTLSRGTGLPGPAGPPGPPGTGGSAYDAANRSGSDLPPGTPAAVHPSGVGFVAATAADNLNNAAGLLAAGAAAGAAATVTTAGAVTLADWSAVAGSATLLPRAAYYLGVAPGTITAVPPAGAGQVVQPVGRAVAPDTLDVAPGPPILL